MHNSNKRNTLYMMCSNILITYAYNTFQFFSAIFSSFFYYSSNASFYVSFLSHFFFRISHNKYRISNMIKCGLCFWVRTQWFFDTMISRKFQYTHFFITYYVLCISFIYLYIYEAPTNCRIDST